MMTSSSLNQRRKKGNHFVSWRFKLFPVRLPMLFLIFLGGSSCVQSQGQLTLISAKWVQNLNTVSSKCPLAPMNVTSFFNATLGSLVHPSQLHCIFSNVVSNFKWFEWWAFHLLPGQCNPRVPGLTAGSWRQLCCKQQPWGRSGRAPEVLIVYGNLVILLRGH